MPGLTDLDHRDRERIRAIKAERAAALARRVRDTGRELTRAAERVLVVRAGEERYGFPLGPIEHIAKPPVFTPLPGVPSFVAGIASFAGEPITVVDLARVLGRPRGEDAPGARVVLVRTRGEKVAVLVDAVEGMRPLDALEPLVRPEGTPSSLAPDQVRGVIEGGVLVLDIEKVLAAPRLAVDEGAREEQGDPC